MSAKNAKEINIHTHKYADGDVRLSQKSDVVIVAKEELPALIEILQSYVEQPKMRYFYIAYNYSKGTGDAFAKGEEYPSIKDIANKVGEQPIVITNIIELSEQDYNSFTK